MSDYVGEPGTVVALIQRDHRVIQGLLDRFEVVARHERDDVFRDAVDYLVRHEVAEEQVVFPALRESVGGSDEFAEECATEQGRIAARIVRMGDMDAASLDFWDEASLLVRDVRAHATHEEQVILPMLRGAEGVDLHELGRRYERARTQAAGHPDPPPGVGSSPGVLEEARNVGQSLLQHLRHRGTTTGHAG